MASNAFTGHLLSLLRDADHLYDASGQLPVGIPGRPLRVAALNRAVIVMCASAWEAYIEELARESLNVLRPAAPPLGLWPALNASVRGQLGRFNTPNTENIRMLISDALGLHDIQTSWVWQNCTSAQAVQRLADAMTLRHQIAHGVNPRPVVATFYSSQLPDFFRRLGRCTDHAVRDHFVNVLGVANPWPP
ncbi:MAG: HEPN domain-containing protein [Isosphaerales bacterium]